MTRRVDGWINGWMQERPGLPTPTTAHRAPLLSPRPAPSRKIVESSERQTREGEAPAEPPRVPPRLQPCFPALDIPGSRGYPMPGKGHPASHTHLRRRETTVDFIKPERIWLKTRPELNERTSPKARSRPIATS